MQPFARQVVETAAPKGVGLAELEEAVLLQAEIMDLQASAAGRAEGTVVEARRDKGQGPVATIIVKRGCLQACRSSFESFESRSPS
jgi:translation initiation factor IF-2